MAVQEGRTLSGTNVINRAMEGGEAGDHIGAVEFVEMEIGKTCDQLGDVASGGLVFYRNRKCVVVILHAYQQIQFHHGRVVILHTEFYQSCDCILNSTYADLAAMVT